MSENINDSKDFEDSLDDSDFSGTTTFSYGIYFSSEDQLLPPTEEEVEDFLTGNNYWHKNFRKPDEYGFAITLPYAYFTPSMIKKSEVPELFKFENEINIVNSLNAEDEEILENADSLFILRYIGPNFDDKQHIVFLMMIIEAYRNKLHGVVYDDSAHIFWGSTVWVKDVLRNVIDGDFLTENFVAFHDVIQEKPNKNGQQLIWLHTHGLGRFGVAELEIANIPRDFINIAFEFLNEIAQDFIEGITYNAEDVLFTEEQNKIKLVEADTFNNSSPDEHYEFSRALRLVDFDDETKQSLQKFLTGYEKVLRNNDILLFHNDPEVTKAHEQAVKNLPKFQKLWVENNEKDYAFVATAGFEIKKKHIQDDLKNEMLIIQITDWQGDKISGILDARPLYCDYLTEGDAVSIDVRDIYDWSVYSAEGDLIDGGFVQDVLNQKIDDEDEV